MTVTLRQIAQPVQFVEELARHPFDRPHRFRTAPRRQGVDFIEEENRRADLLGLFEYLMQRLSDSPTTSKEDRAADWMKFNPVSPAKAFTIRVLPVPDGTRQEDARKRSCLN